ncbi:hypothetical protein HanIR_Chr04g0171521 [Helianthus annuus]|nr:hypothetical protein HanIR_Chr04g0171521 [Helianthus annuus]
MLFVEITELHDLLTGASTHKLHLGSSPKAARFDARPTLPELLVFENQPQLEPRQGGKLSSRHR